MTDTFATAINCIEGQYQQPVEEWAKQHCEVSYVDVITEYGPDKVLAQGSVKELQRVKTNAEHSHLTHGSESIVIAGHEGCSGNNVSKEEHFHQIRQCANTIAGWGMYGRVVGLWVAMSGTVEVVLDIPPK